LELGTTGKGAEAVLDAKCVRWSGWRTLSCVARFVIFGEVIEVDIFQPGNPFLVLLVILVFRPLHGCVGRSQYAVEFRLGWVEFEFKSVVRSVDGSRKDE
jgi:hypothetical protein